MRIPTLVFLLSLVFPIFEACKDGFQAVTVDENNPGPQNCTREMFTFRNITTPELGLYGAVIFNNRATLFTLIISCKPSQTSNNHVSIALDNGVIVASPSRVYCLNSQWYLNTTTGWIRETSFDCNNETPNTVEVRITSNGTTSG